jgi:hypothetical protein
MEYDPLFSLPTGIEDIESVFKTGRGSTYAHHADTTTTRNRSGANHTDKSTGIQQRSGKTIYMNPNDVNKVAGIYQNSEMATKLVPVLDNGKPTGQVALQLTEDYGPRKAGSTLVQASYATKPAVGLNPVEIFGSESPMGSSGRNIHFGNAITEVHPKPARLGGKAAIAAALASGAGAASAGELSKAAGDVAESMLPWWMTGGNAGPADESEQVALRQRMAEAGAKAGAGRGNPNYDPRLYKQPIEMPSEYQSGGRVRII